MQVSDPPVKLRPATPKRVARYQQLMRAAITIFARNGFDAASVADIAEAAGVAKGSVYLYFPSKEALAGDMVGFLFSMPAQSLLILEEPEPIARLEAFCDELEDRIGQLGEDGSLVLHMLGQLGKTEDNQLARGIRQFMAETRYLFELLLSRARDLGHLPARVDPAREATALLATLFGVIHTGLALPGPRATASSCVRTYLRGLKVDQA